MSQQLVWLITGASRGLGLALARRALLRGDLVVATARDVSRFDDVLFADPAIERKNAYVLALDITETFESLKIKLSHAVSHWGRIDVLVNNGGSYVGVGLSEELGADHFSAFMSTNFVGTINVTNAALPHMRAARAGTILVIGSRAPFINDFGGSAPYLAVKAALHAYGESLAVEVRSFGIRVTVVLPGGFKTDPGGGMPIKGHPIQDYDDFRNALERRIAQRKKMPNQGDPEKGMDVLVDVIHGQGRAKGKQGWPLWLVLGDDGIENVRGRLKRMGETLDEWESVGTRLGEEDDSNSAST